MTIGMSNGSGNPPRTALLLIAHGSRQDEANADLHHLVVELRQGGRHPVEASFLELAEPTIEQGAARCIEQDADRVVLLPYFLSAGVHVRRDLTAICASLAQQHPLVQFHLAEPLGRHPLLLEIIAQRANEAVNQLIN